MKKYKIILDKYKGNKFNYVQDGDIIELEELEQEEKPLFNIDKIIKIGLIDWIKQNCNSTFKVIKGYDDGFTACFLYSEESKEMFLLDSGREEKKDCPASECDGEECECEHNWGINVDTKPKEPNESLEEKFSKDVAINPNAVKRIAQIARSHYQSHPEEIDCVKNGVHQITIDLVNAFRKENKGMVKLSDVLRVFDGASAQDWDEQYENRNISYTEFLRKAIENMGEKK